MLPVLFGLISLGWAGGAARAQAPGAPLPTRPPQASVVQAGDTSFAILVPHPAFETPNGPRVLVDNGHFNFHTIDGRFAPFARLLRLDGFLVQPLGHTLTRKALDSAAVLVIANALNVRNTRGNWALPTPSAFEPGEVSLIADWVADGGALLLIADHMPFPGAAAELGAAFGVTMLNGFAADSQGDPADMVFRRSDGTLGAHPVVDGQGPDERIDSVRSFTGQAFRAPAAAHPILKLRPSDQVLLPRVAWAFDDSTPRLPAVGLTQGLMLTHGRGRVAIFGEAAMFTAQVFGESNTPIGMNAPQAAQNAQFLLNLMHWLVGHSSSRARPGD